jgi:hypothetical protein
MLPKKYSDEHLRDERARKLAAQTKYVRAKTNALRNEHLHTQILETGLDRIVKEMKTIIAESRLSPEEKDEIFQNLNSIAGIVKQHALDQAKTFVEVKRKNGNGNGESEDHP